jgi:hypothetical protein
MKTGFVIVGLTVGLLAGLMAGVSPAGDARMTHLQGIYNADPERGVGDSWQDRGPIETGALPDAAGGESMTRESPTNDAGFTFVEIGSAGYRVGLDTGP